MKILVKLVDLSTLRPRVSEGVEHGNSMRVRLAKSHDGLLYTADDGAMEKIVKTGVTG